MHDYRFMWLQVFRIINYRCQLITGYEENVSFPEKVGGIRLNDLGFA